jgi:hypothetical protein
VHVRRPSIEARKPREVAAVSIAAALFALVVVGALRAGSPIQLAAQVETGMLLVEVKCGAAGATGSGFLVGPRLMITATHVLEAASGCASVVTQQGSGAQARVPRWNYWFTSTRRDKSTTDLAVALLDRPITGYYFRIETRERSGGERVIALGYPYAEALSVTQGRVVDLYSRFGVPVMALRLLSDHGGSGGPILNLSGKVVGLTQRGSRAGQVVESLDITAFTGGRPITLCDALAREAGASTVCGARPVASTSSSNIYTGRTFSIRYPLGWRVVAAEVDKGTYVDTTITDPRRPSWLLRIDLGGNPTSSPSASAAPVIRALRRQPGYRELGLREVTFLGYDALRWEFLVREKGQLLHKVDIFFIDSRRRGWAVLFQSPASEWSASDPRFSAAVASLRIH